MAPISRGQNEFGYLQHPPTRSAQFWLNLQSAYDLGVGREKVVGKVGGSSHSLRLKPRLSDLVAVSNPSRAL
jgi:hypothetical protein